MQVGVVGHEDPNKRPLLVLANDESTFKSKRSNPRHWKDVKQDKLAPKDYGTGRMISGFAHEYLGLLKLTPDELDKANRIRAARGDPPMKHLHFCVKAFDYGVNRQGYWNTDDMIEHCVEVMDGLDAKFGVGQYQYLFLFDHSANHEAFAEDALRASVMSKGWGGKQPKLRSTVFYKHKAVLREDIQRHPRHGWGALYR